MARAFLWGKEQGDIGLKNIFFAGNSEASDRGVGRQAGGGDITACSRSPNKRKFWKSGSEEELETDVPSGAI
jgi:hypothetical protein